MEHVIEDIKIKPPADWGGKHYYPYNEYLRGQYGEKVHKVSLHGGFTCPNRDGKQGYGGCIYCNNDSFVPEYINSDMDIAQQFDVSIPFMQKRYGANKHIAYFQAYSNTYAELDKLKELYKAAIDQPGIVGLDIGTRSDCVDEELLEYLAELNEQVDVTLEYGIESRHDETLKWMNRGHDFASIQDAVELTRKYGLKVGGHIILGFPVEDHDRMLETGIAANELGLDFLKIHQLHIVKGTVLAHRYNQKRFHVFSTAEYIELVIDILERLNPKIVIQRLFGDAPDPLLIAPRWGYSIPELLYQLDQAFIIRETWQGRRFDFK